MSEQTVYATGYITMDGGNDGEFGILDLNRAFAASGGDATIIHINSYGGEAYAGIALYNLLRAHKSKTIAVVDGIAASAASVMAFGASSVIIPRNAFMHIHNAWACKCGDSKDHERSAEELAQLDAALLSIYAARAKSGIDESTLKKLIERDCAMTAEEVARTFEGITVVDSATEIYSAMHFGETPTRSKPNNDPESKTGFSTTTGSNAKAMVNGELLKRLKAFLGEITNESGGEEKCLR